MGTSHAALFDELTKIASDEKKPHWVKDVAKAMLATAAGAGLGEGAAMLAERALPNVFLQQHPAAVKSMKIILPILGGASFYVGNRLRRRLEDEYSKAPGYIRTTE